MVKTFSWEAKKSPLSFSGSDYTGDENGDFLFFFTLVYCQVKIK